MKANKKLIFLLVVIFLGLSSLAIASFIEPEDFPPPHCVNTSVVQHNCE